MKNQNTIVNTENCLFYGLPGIIILALSLMASTRISSDFGGDTFIKTVSFLGCNGLLWLLYLAVCQYMLADLVTLCTLMVKKVRNGNNTEPVETLVVEEYTGVPLIEDRPEQVTVAATYTAESAPVVTKEEYRTYCADFEQKQQDNSCYLSIPFLIMSKGRWHRSLLKKTLCYSVARLKRGVTILHILPKTSPSNVCRTRKTG